MALGLLAAAALLALAAQTATPVALTARWTNDYQTLLNREASSLPAVDVAAADAPGGVERADEVVQKEQHCSLRSICACAPLRPCAHVSVRACVAAHSPRCPSGPSCQRAQGAGRIRQGKERERPQAGTGHCAPGEGDQC